MAKQGMSASPKKVQGAPPAEQDAVTAPWPITDKFPTVLGSNVSLQTVASIFRLTQIGYRQNYVDLLDELLEREPHAYACMAQRVLNVVSGRIEIVPADTEPGSEDEKIARMLAEKVSKDFHNIEGLTTALFNLTFSGLYYAIGADEISWSNDGDPDWKWRPTRLHFIHSRRLAYPDPQDWRLHIWDQGQVLGFNSNRVMPTQAVFGVAIDTLPGKFIVHSPQLRADYPTRDGLGRELAIWMCLKGLGARGAAQYIERFGKPWAVATYATKPDGIPRAANDADLAKADAAMKSLGAGSLAGATLPDSVNLDLFGPGLKQGRIGITHTEWMEFCNSEMTKVIRGQTFTTEAGAYGSRSTSSVGQSGELRIAGYDASCLAESIKRDLIFWMVKLNAPEHIRLCPKVKVHVEDEPDPLERIDIASKAAAAGIPVDADAMGDELALPLIPKPEGPNSEKSRRMVPLAPMKPTDIPGLEDPEAALKAQQDLQQAAAQAKADALQQQPQGPNDPTGKAVKPAKASAKAAPKEKK